MESNQRIKWLILGAVLTIIAGVIVNVVTPFFTSKNQRLEYSVLKTIPFQGEEGKIAIYHVVVRNGGGTVLKDTSLVVSVNSAIFQDWRITIEPSIEYTTSNSSGSVSVSVPSLNPKEIFSVSIFAFSPIILPNEPDVSIRSEGVTAEEVEMTFTEIKSIVTFPWITILVVIVVISISTGYIILRENLIE